MNTLLSLTSVALALSLIWAIALRVAIRYTIYDTTRRQQYVRLRWIVAAGVTLAGLLFWMATGSEWALLFLTGLPFVPMVVEDPYAFQRTSSPDTPDYLFSHSFVDLSRMAALRKQWAEQQDGESAAPRPRHR